LPLRLSTSLKYQVVATFERQGELLRSTTTMAGSFMPLRGAGTNPIEPPSYSLSAFARGAERPLLASLEGPPLEQLPAQGRPALASLLQPAQTLANLSGPAAGGLIAYLLLRGRGPFCSCVVDGRWGVAVLAEKGASIATVTRQVGGAGRIESFGSGHALDLLDRYRDEWLKRGSPTAGDLRLAVSFGATASRRAWRHIPLGGCVVTVNWHQAPQSSATTEPSPQDKPRGSTRSPHDAVSTTGN
jgi:hypothetical protein